MTDLTHVRVLRIVGPIVLSSATVLTLTRSLTMARVGRPIIAASGPDQPKRG